MTKKLIILIIILILVLIGNVIYYLGRSPEKGREPVLLTPSPLPEEEEVVGKIEEPQAPEEEKELGWGRDPFVTAAEERLPSSSVGEPPAAEPAAGLPLPFTFYGSWLSSEGNLALIGEKVVSEGELFEGWWVVKIAEDFVELERGGRTETLFLPEPTY